MGLPGEQLLIKFWETLADKGVGALLGPWQIRRQGRASAETKRHEMLLLAQAEQDVESIRRGEKRFDEKGELVEIKQAFLESASELLGNGAPVVTELLVKNLEKIEHVDLLEKQIRLSKIALYAEEYLLEDNELSGESTISEDWFRRWRDCAKDISEDSLQQIWGRLLSGEFKTPGKYSLRTLEFVKNISQREAQLIAELGPFVLNVFGVIFANSTDYLEKKGLAHHKIVELQELGIILGPATGPVDYSIRSGEDDRFENVIFCNEIGMLVNSDIQFKKIEFKAYVLTKVAKELIELGVFSADEEYWNGFCRYVKGRGFKVRVGRWISLSGNTVQFLGIKDFE